MSQEESGEEVRAEVVPEDELTAKEAAKLAGVTERAVRMAQRDGRLRRCNRASDPARFKRREIERWIELRENGGKERPPHEEVELAKADAVTDLVAQSQTHTEHAWESNRLMSIEYRKGVDAVLGQVLAENKRMQTRITELEAREDELRASISLLDKARYDETIAKAEAAKIEERNKTLMGIGKMVAPAVLARWTGNEQLNQGAFKGLVTTLTSAQRDRIFETMGSVLDENQMLVLMTLLSGWEAQETKEKQTSAPHDTERPPGDAKDAG